MLPKQHSSVSTAIDAHSQVHIGHIHILTPSPKRIGWMQLGSHWLLQSQQFCLIAGVLSAVKWKHKQEQIFHSAYHESVHCCRIASLFAALFSVIFQWAHKNVWATNEPIDWHFRSKQKVWCMSKNGNYCCYDAIALYYSKLRRHYFSLRLKTNIRATTVFFMTKN